MCARLIAALSLPNGLFKQCWSPLSAMPLPLAALAVGAGCTSCLSSIGSSASVDGTTSTADSGVNSSGNSSDSSGGNSGGDVDVDDEVEVSLVGGDLAC